MNAFRALLAMAVIHCFFLLNFEMRSFDGLFINSLRVMVARCHAYQFQQTFCLLR